MGRIAAAPLVRRGARLPHAALLLWIALGACGEGAREGQGPAGSAARAGDSLLAGLAPRRAIRGLEGFRSRSLVSFAGDPDEPHELLATYAFPGRAHWRLQREGARPGERRLFFFCGERVFTIANEDDTSIEFEREAQLQARLRAELRRVGMTWPADLEWVERDGARWAELPGLGQLRADQLDERDRPGRLAAFGPDGLELERFEGIGWVGPARWPSQWTLATPSGPIWEERLLEVTTGIALLDRYFLPPDRLSAPEAGGWDRAAVQEIRLPARAGRRRPLPAGSGWPAVRAQAASWIEEERGRLGTGLGLEDEPAVELDGAGHPVAVWLRLSSVPESLPDGWQALGPGRAQALWLDRPERLNGGLLAEIRIRPDSPSHPEPPFVWLRAPGEGQDAQLVVPLGGS